MRLPTTTLLALWLAFPGGSSAQTSADAYSPSPRVGAEIDAEERRYFGLFPQREGFERAWLYEAGDSLRVTARSSGEGAGARDTTWQVSRAQGAALGAFVEGFEGLRVAYDFERWQALGVRRNPLVDAAVPIPHVDAGRPDVRVTVGGARYDGVVLAVSDTLLLLHAAGRPYDWRAPALVTLDPRAIDWLEVVPERQPASRWLVRLGTTLAGAGIALPFVLRSSDEPGSGRETLLVQGLLAGLAAGSLAADAILPRGAQGTGTYGEYLPDLRARARFRVRFPIDLPPAEAFARGRTEPAVTSAPTARVGSLRWRLAEWRRTYGLLNVAVLGSAGLWGHPETTTFEERLSGRPDPFTSTSLREGLAPAIGIDAAVRPVPWVRVGATWQPYDRTEPDRREGFSIGEEVARTMPGSLRGYAEVVLPTPRAGGFALELALGGGLERNRVSVTREGAVVTTPLRYEYEESGMNPFLQGALELVLPRRSSVFARYTRRSLPTLAVEAVEIPENPNSPFPTGRPMYELEAHGVGFGYQELTWGTRFRF